MAALGAKAMRMQVECPICNTKLVFEVLPQYAGRTVRVTCTNCETPIDASTDMPASSAHQMQHFEQETRLQLANGLASRMHGQAPQNSGPGVEINKPIQQNPNMQQHNVQQQIQQQQHQLQKTSQQQKQDNGAGKNSTETLQYEVQCPHPECAQKIIGQIERKNLGILRIQCPRCASKIDCTLQHPGMAEHSRTPTSQIPSGPGHSQQAQRTAPAPLPPLNPLPKPMSALRYLAMMMRKEVSGLNGDEEVISSDDDMSLDDTNLPQKEVKSEEQKEPSQNTADPGSAHEMARNSSKTGEEQICQVETCKEEETGKAGLANGDAVNAEEKAKIEEKEGMDIKIECSDASQTIESVNNTMQIDGATTSVKKEEDKPVEPGGVQVQKEMVLEAAETNTDGIETEKKTMHEAAAAKQENESCGEEKAKEEETEKKGIEENIAKTKLGKMDKIDGLTHELVGDILMCWSMLRRLASHLMLPDLALDSFVAAICSEPGSHKKNSTRGSDGNECETESDEESGDEVGGNVNDDGCAPVRSTYQDDVYISLLYELCSELRRRETLVPSSGALNVHTWPEALRTYLYWMAHHVYLVSVGCDRDTQNERPDTQDGTDEGKRRLTEMEEEMQNKSNELLRVTEQLKVSDYSSLSLADRILVLSTLCNQLLHTAKFHQQVDQEEMRAIQVKYSLHEIMTAIGEEDSFSSTPLRVTVPALPEPSPIPEDADEETRQTLRAEREKLEVDRENRNNALRNDDAAKRAAHVKRIVRPVKALLHGDGTKLQSGVDLKGTEVLVNGLANGHELPAGVRRCKGVIFRTLMPGWHEVRRTDWPGAHPSAYSATSAKPIGAGGAGGAVGTGGGEDKVMDAAALLDSAFVCDEELRKLHQVMIKTAKLELLAEADRRCTVLTCREEPLGYDRHDRAVMRWNGYLNEVFVLDQQHRWGVYRGEALERYTVALEGSQKRPKTGKDSSIIISEGRILESLRKVKEFIAALKKVGGDVEAVADMMKPRETQVLSLDARRVRNGELNASPHLQEQPGEIICASTGETYSPKTHVHCPITFVTIDKQHYNSQKAGKAKGRGTKGTNAFPAAKTWKAHLADFRTMLTEDTNKYLKFRSHIEKLALPEFAPPRAAGGKDKGQVSVGEEGADSGDTALTKGCNDVISISDFESVVTALELAPTSEHLMTWRALPGPSVNPGLIHYLEMFNLLEAIKSNDPMALPPGLAPVKRALMDMEAAIPDPAMPFWGDERREQWVYMVKYASSVDELLVSVLYLEACIERSWMRVRSRPISKRLRLKFVLQPRPLPDDEDSMITDTVEALVAEDDVEVEEKGEEGGEEEGGEDAADVGSKRKAGDENGGEDEQEDRRETKMLEPQTHELTHHNPYQNFVKAMAAELRITEPELKGPGKMKRLGQLWQTLSEDDHKKWVRQSYHALPAQPSPAPDLDADADGEDINGGGTRSWKGSKNSKDQDSSEGGDASQSGGGGGRARRSVPAVSTVNLDKHSHFTLVQDGVQDEDSERRQQLSHELSRILSRAYEVADVAMTNAGLASLVYLLDANFNFDRNAASDAEIEVPARQSNKPAIQRTGTLIWLRTEAKFPWPAEVCSSDQADMERNTGKVLLQLFGTEEEVWVSPDKCMPFEHHLDKFKDKLAKDNDGKLALRDAVQRHQDILSIKKSEGIDNDTGMYKVPEVFDKQMRVGAIVEVEVEDPKSHKTQWLPAKVVRLDAKGTFHVDIKIITSDERGSWEERYTAKEENKEWRWPSASS